jgi:hypothetical protein
MPWFDPGTPGRQSQTKWQAFTRQCGAGEVRRPSPTRRLDQPYGLIGSDLLTPQIIDDHVSALAGKRQSNRATCAVRRQTAGGTDRPIARANTFRKRRSVAFRLPLRWTAPIRARQNSSMSNAIIKQQGDSPGEPSSVQQDPVWVVDPMMAASHSLLIRHLRLSGEEGAAGRRRRPGRR